MRIFLPALCLLLAAPALAQDAPSPAGAGGAQISSGTAAGAAAAPGGRPAKPAAAVSVYTAYAAPGGLISRRTGTTGEAALGKAAGFALRASADLAHIRSLGGGYFPGELYRAAFGLSAENNGTRLAVNLHSNSDRPFNSPAETDLGFTLTHDLPDGGRSTWLLGLNYSTRRSFLRGVPLPFVGYRYVTKELTLMLPFLVRWQATRELALSASYQPVKYFRAGLNWRPLPYFRADLEGGLTLEQFLPAGRRDKSEELFYQTAYISLKPALSFSRRFEVTPALGWQFSGLYYRGARYDEFKDKVRLRGGPTCGLSARYAF